MTLHMDPEVQQALAILAGKYGMEVFSPDTPNRVLRILLAIDEPPGQTASGPEPESGKPIVPTNSSAITTTNTQRSDQGRKRFGTRLLREHRLNCAKGYYSDTGKPYQKPKPDGFPVVFFDPNGYLIVRDEQSMRSNPDINVGAQVSIPGGISKIPGYVKCGHVHV